MSDKLYSLYKLQRAVEEIECWQFIDEVISRAGASKDLCPWEFTLNTGSSQAKDKRPSESDWEASFSRGEYLGPDFPNNGWIKHTVFMADEDRLQCLKLLIEKFKQEEGDWIYNNE
jgi:hypothetical protein